MKRLILLALVATMVLGAAKMAFAVDHDMVSTGEMRFSFVWADNSDFFDIEDDGESEDDFYARQRYRNQVQYVTENMKAVVYFEIGETNWGFGAGQTVGKGTGGQLGADAVNIETRRAYIEFMVPDTALLFRVGIQGIALPSATGLGNPILGGTGTDLASVLAAYTINDMVSVNAVWARAFDDGSTLAADSPEHDEYDVFGLIVPINFDGGNLTPYALYAKIGADVLGSADDYDAWWGGAAFTLDMFDPFVFMADIAYGNADTDADAGDMEGWYIDAELDYKMDMMTPGIAAWWASGNDDDATDGTESLPEIDGAFFGTTYGFDGYSLLAAGDIVDDDALGTWGIAFLIKNLTFVENLSHTIRVAYLQGTTDEDGTPSYAALTEEDSAWEVNFDSTYMIYENLAAIVEMGYVSVDLDGVDDEEDAWKVGFGLQYSF